MTETWKLLGLGTEFWSALVGAIIGGCIGLGGQWYAVRAARKQRLDDLIVEEAQRAREALSHNQALAHSLLFKMMKIVSSLIALRNHVENSISNAADEGHKGKMWQVILPLANPPDRVTFSADEMAMLMSLHADDVFNTVMSQDDIHNNLIPVFELYATRRREATENFGAMMDGNLGTTELTYEQMALFAPREVELEMLAAAMRERANRDAKDALNAMHELHRALNEKLDLRLRLRLKEVA